MERARKRQRLSSSLPAKSHSQRLQPELSKSPEFSKFPGSLSPPPRWPGRQFHRCVSKSPVSPEACQKILSSFDFEKSDHEQSESVILELEKWMGYEGWPWVDEHDRARIIRDKAFSTLYKFLWSYRYYWLTSTIVDGKPRLIISPNEGIEPLPLPEWLSTPYIIPVPYQDFTYKPETSKGICKNPIITSDHAVLDSDQRRVGTFSCLMNTTRSPQNHQLTWVCPSVGYLIGDLASELFVKPYDTTGQISLQVATTSVGTCGRPKHSIDKKPSFRDDCAFLLVKECDLHTFQCVISNVNPFYLIPDLPGQVDILDPLSISRFCDIEWTMQTNHLIVYKHGSSTQLTVGRLVKMTRHPPRGWYNGNSRNNLENEMDENEWMGVVDWNGLPFSSPSDSGSLISRLRTVYMFHLEFMFLLMSS